MYRACRDRVLLIGIFARRKKVTEERRERQQTRVTSGKKCRQSLKKRDNDTLPLVG